MVSLQGIDAPFSAPADSVKVIKGQGMPSYRHHELGDIYVRMNVVFPDSLPETAFPLLETALAPRQVPAKPATGHVEEVMVEEPDPTRARRDENGMDEDEEAGGHGPHGVQCANQVRCVDICRVCPELVAYPRRLQ